MTRARNTDYGAELVNAAANLVGTPFRLHGHDPATGLDCVGLVSAALAATGQAPSLPEGYGLRNVAVDQWLGHAGRSGLARSPGPIVAGDVLLIALGHCQHHLAIAADADTVIHAHAGLREVVQQPFEADWRVCAKWRVDPLMKG